MELSETEKEMLESKHVCENFDFQRTADLAKRIGTKRIIFTGMGSSLIFPAKQAKNRAMHLGLANKVDVFYASDLFQYSDFADTFIFLCTNSGRTKETVLLAEHAKKHGAYCIAVTANKDSIITTKCDETIVLTCGFEKGVAATKSVVEQGLIYDSLVFNLAKYQGKNIDFLLLKKELKETGEKIVENANLKINEKIVAAIAERSTHYFTGLETGVAEELSLKTFEIARKTGLYFADTQIAHGAVETLSNGCTILIEPEAFVEFIADFQTFSEKSSSLFISVGKKANHPELIAETIDSFKNYCLLAAGWGLLRNIAHYNNVDIDRPEKAEKVGNPYQG